MRFSLPAAIAALLPLASSTVFYAGVAESGGEFGVWSGTSTPGTGLPGTFGVEYAFISEAGIDISVDKNKINLFRVAFLAERLCPPATGLGAKFDEVYFGHFKRAIDYITVTKKAYAILDVHNYMRYNDPSSQPYSGSIIGDTKDPKAATSKQFAEFWAELAARFISNERVIFGLMNEPHDMSSALNNVNLQGAIDAIRKLGSKHLILAPANNWSGGHAWSKYGAESAALWMNKLRDPANNTAIDVHQYLDEDFSGGHTECKSDPVANLAPLTQWLKENKLKAFITEFGGSNTTECIKKLGTMLDYMGTNPEYIGWTAWAAGPFWGPYSPCCTDGAALGSLEPGSKATDGGPSLYDTVWVPVFQKKVPKKLHWNGFATVNGGPLTERA